MGKPEKFFLSKLAKELPVETHGRCKMFLFSYGRPSIINCSCVNHMKTTTCLIAFLRSQCGKQGKAVLLKSEAKPWQLKHHKRTFIQNPSFLNVPLHKMHSKAL